MDVGVLGHHSSPVQISSGLELYWNVTAVGFLAEVTLDVGALSGISGAFGGSVSGR